MKLKLLFVMGQVFRIMTYDSAGNRCHAVTALQLARHDLQWFRLDDGVMGGLSTTQHKQVVRTSGIGRDQGNNDNIDKKDNNSNTLLHFEGIINTNGGGFCSIRSEFPAGILTAQYSAVKIRFRGDGKTYKVLLRDGSRGGPTSTTPSWQIDLPTQSLCSATNEGVDGDTQAWEEAVLP